jgi:hypothetical protein
MSRGRGDTDRRLWARSVVGRGSVGVSGEGSAPGRLVVTARGPSDLIEREDSKKVVRERRRACDKVAISRIAQHPF